MERLGRLLLNYDNVFAKEQKYDLINLWKILHSNVQFDTSGKNMTEDLYKSHSDSFSKRQK